MEKIAVIGAGTMGAGIAQVFGQHGHKVILIDNNSDTLKKAEKDIESGLQKLLLKGKINTSQQADCINNLSYSNQIEDAQADFVLEVIVENLAIKRDIYAKLEDINPSTTIIATNTSSLSIATLGATLKHPERFVGVHFFNPATIMRLVEITTGPKTAADIATKVAAICKNAGKVTVACKDAPGFIVNRVARVFYTEALHMLDEGTTTINTIDTLMEAAGFKMGPFRLMDLIGNDINFEVTKSLYAAFHQEARFRPSRAQALRIATNTLGRKTMEGFYQYPDNK